MKNTLARRVGAGGGEGRLGWGAKPVGGVKGVGGRLLNPRAGKVCECWRGAIRTLAAVAVS